MGNDRDHVQRGTETGRQHRKPTSLQFVVSRPLLLFLNEFSLLLPQITLRDTAIRRLIMKSRNKWFWKSAATREQHAHAATTSLTKLFSVGRALQVETRCPFPNSSSRALSMGAVIRTVHRTLGGATYVKGEGQKGHQKK